MSAPPKFCDWNKTATTITEHWRKKNLCVLQSHTEKVNDDDDDVDDDGNIE